MSQAVKEPENLFAASAALLRGDPVASSEALRGATAFLAELGYLESGSSGARSEPAGASANRLALLSVAQRLPSVFRLAAPDAPGLCFVGGAADPAVLGPSLAGEEVASLAGAGLTLAQAFEACVGEGVEYLSQFELEGDRQRHLPAGEAPPADGLATAFFADWLGLDAGSLDRRPWVPAMALGDGTPTRLPADLVFRRGQDRSVRSRVPLGSGCSAGPTWHGAALAALLEAIERDAVALWWVGGRPAAAVREETLAAWQVPETIAALRGGSSGRATTIVDITSDIAVPCFAAISFRSSGDGFAAGYAAGIDPARAVRSAVIEMCQMELGQRLIEHKVEKMGRDALNDAERRHLGRAETITPADCFTDLRAPIDHPPLRAGSDAERLRRAVHRLAAAGHAAYAVDLTRQSFAVPVTRVVVPGLQPYPSEFISQRLANHRLIDAGQAPHRAQLALF